MRRERDEQKHPSRTKAGTSPAKARGPGPSPGRGLPMIAPQPIGFLNTGLPVILLATLVLLLPRLILPADNLSQQALALAVAVTALAALAAGAVIFALVYAAGGVGVAASMAEAFAPVAVFFLRLSALAALVWGPVLALGWVAMAQAVEKRRGEDAARRNK